METAGTRDPGSRRRRPDQRLGRLLDTLGARLPRWALVVVGLALVLTAGWMVTRPITTVGILSLVLGAAGVLVAVALLAGGVRPSPDWVDVALAAPVALAGLALIAQGGYAAGLLVPALCLWWILRGLHGAVTGVRAACRDVPRLLRGVARVVFGVLGLLRLDVALVVITTIFCLIVLVRGLRLVSRGARGTSAPVLPAPVRTVTRWTGAVTALVLALGATVVVVTTRDDIVVSDFYATPADLPHTPGALLRTEPYDGEVSEGLSALRLLYVTTDEFGRAVPASAVLAVPAEPAGPVPLISWGHGTVGVVQKCAPSLGPHAVSAEALPIVDRLVDNEWAVVLTDYPGQGTDAAFPYLIGPGQGQAILDAARAARQVPDVQFAEETVIWGHSQGGHAALWAGQLAEGYAPDLTVVGTAALSPAADPYRQAERVLKNPQAPGATLAIAYVVDAYARYYPDLRLEEIVTSAGQVIVRAGASRCTTSPATLETVLVGLMISADRPITHRSALEEGFGAALRANEPTGPWAAPLWIAQGTSDEVIPYRLTTAYAERRCADGVPLALTAYPDGTHMSILELDSRLSDDLEQWTRDRIAGLPAESTC